MKKHIRSKASKGDGLGLLCPHCGGKFQTVTDSRPYAGSIVRTRKCHACSMKFKTGEVIVANKPSNQKMEVHGPEEWRARYVELRDRVRQLGFDLTKVE